MQHTSYFTVLRFQSHESRKGQLKNSNLSDFSYQYPGKNIAYRVDSSFPMASFLDKAAFLSDSGTWENFAFLKSIILAAIISPIIINTILYPNPGCAAQNPKVIAPEVSAAALSAASNIEPFNRGMSVLAGSMRRGAKAK